MMILVYWLWRLGSFLVGHTPLKLTYGAADVLSGVVYWTLPRLRRNAHANYAQVMGRPADDPAVRRVTQTAFRNFCRYLAEVMRFPYVTDAELDRRVVLRQTDEFRAALAQQKGVIFVSAHFGNMELAGVQIAKKIGHLTLAAEVLKARQLYEWLVANRARHNVTLVPYTQAARALLTALRRNELVGFFMDLGIGYDHRGVPVQFFGKTAYFPAAPALLAHRTGAPIIQGFAVIGADGLIHGEAMPTIHVDQSLARDTFVQQATQQMATNMERIIAQYPEQWYIFRPIWPDVSQAVAHDAQPMSAQVG